MPSRSPTICSVDPAPREADSHPPNSSRRARSRPGNRRNRRRQRGRGLERIGEAGGRPIQRHQLEGRLLRHRHHHLLQLGLGPQAHQPDLAARRLPRQVGRLEQRMPGPRIQHGGQASIRSSATARSPAPASATGRARCCRKPRFERCHKSSVAPPSGPAFVRPEVCRQECRHGKLEACSTEGRSIQFSFECSPPAPAVNAILPLAGSSSSGAVQFHRHAPQCTHFSRSNDRHAAGPRRDRLPGAHLDAQLGLRSARRNRETGNARDRRIRPAPAPCRPSAARPGAKPAAARRSGIAGQPQRSISASWHETPRRRQSSTMRPHFFRRNPAGVIFLQARHQPRLAVEMEPAFGEARQRHARAVPAPGRCETRRAPSRRSAPLLPPNLPAAAPRRSAPDFRA